MNRSILSARPRIYNSIYTWSMQFRLFSKFRIILTCMHCVLRKAADEAMDASHTMALPEPWDREPALTRLLLHDGGYNGKCRFHCIDVWHAFHLGVGKAWIASGAMLLQKILPESNADKRIEVIAKGYKDFCKQHRIDPVIRKIDFHTFGLKERNGAWNKACITSNFMLYMEEFCREHADKIRNDEQLRIFETCMTIYGFSCFCLKWISNAFFYIPYFCACILTPCSIYLNMRPTQRRRLTTSFAESTSMMSLFHEMMREPWVMLSMSLCMLTCMKPASPQKRENLNFFLCFQRYTQYMRCAMSFVDRLSSLAGQQTQQFTRVQWTKTS